MGLRRLAASHLRPKRAGCKKKVHGHSLLGLSRGTCVFAPGKSGLGSDFWIGYIVAGRWILGWGNLVHDTTTTMPGTCFEKSASPREGSRRSAVGNTWAGWGSIPVVFFSRPTCDVPFPPRRPGEYWQLMFPARPLYRAPGGQGIGLGSRTFERASGPSCVLPKGVQQGQTESGGIVLAVICWAPSAQRRCHPTGRCTYRPSVIY